MWQMRKAGIPRFTSWAVEWIVVLGQRIGEGGRDCARGYEDDDDFCLGKLFMVLAVSSLSKVVCMKVI